MIRADCAIAAPLVEAEKGLGQPLFSQQWWISVSGYEAAVPRKRKAQRRARRENGTHAVGEHCLLP